MFQRRTPTSPTHNLSGLDSVSPSDGLGLAEASQVASASYIYYRIYAEDGAIPSKTPAPSDPFLGRIKARSVAPPHTVKAVKLTIAKKENVEDRTSASIFLTPYSESPMGDDDKFSILNRSGPGSTPQDPLAFVAKISDSERRALESGGTSGLASTEDLDTTSEIRYLYYLLYSDNCEIPSKVAFDPEEPSLGRIRVDSVAPPHSSVSIKRRISRVERNPELAHADIFADITCDTPLKEGHMSNLRTHGPGLSLNEPMAIVHMPRAVTIVQAEYPPIPDGVYFIKNRAAYIFWAAELSPITAVHLRSGTRVVKDSTGSYKQFLWNVTHHSNGNISIRSLHAPSSWVGAEITGSTVPVPWRLIPAGDEFYYLTTDINPASQNSRVLSSQPGRNDCDALNVPGLMATLKEGDQLQMWSFVDGSAFLM